MIWKNILIYASNYVYIGKLSIVTWFVIMFTLS